jgi:hypothetical protein
LREFRIPDELKKELGDFDYTGEGVSGSDGMIGDAAARDVGWFPVKARAGSLTDELLDTIISRGLHDKQQMARLVSPAPKMLAIIFRDPITGKRFCKFRSKGIAESACLNGDTSELMSAGALFDAISTGSSLTLEMPDRLKKLAPGSIKPSERSDCSCQLFSIKQCDLVRTILSKPWQGRKHIGSGITAPYGWISDPKP